MDRDAEDLKRMTDLGKKLLGKALSDQISAERKRGEAKRLMQVLMGQLPAPRLQRTIISLAVSGLLRT